MSGWTAPERTSEAQAVYAAAEADRVANPDRYRLDPDRIVARATRDRDPGWLGDSWEDGLAAYLSSAEHDGRLNALGVRMVQETAASRLRAGASIARHLHDHPDVLERELIPPLVIVGGWRTGTTFLFRLLATDPRLRAPLPVELSAPWRVAGLAGVEREAMIDAASAAHDSLHFLNPRLQAVHDSGARLAEECVLAMGTDFRNWGFTSTVRLESYGRWLAEQSMAGSYERYRCVLQMLDHGDGRRWVLKAPAHTAELDHLVAAFPGACVVHLHRDIVETVASGASLFAVFRSTYSDAVDPHDVGRLQTEQTELWLRRSTAFRASPAAAGATFLDVRYEDLVADPVATVATICEAARLAPPDDLTAMVAAYDVAHPRHGKGVHRYSPAAFGLDESELRSRFSFLPPA